MAEIRTICVYCGSSAGKDPIFAESARELGRALARENIRLIYGGGGIGLMGELAHSVLAAGGEVTGVIPNFLIERERALDGEHALIVTNDMHERKRTMFELADAFVALPGGIGTLEELIEQLTWLQLGQHSKPVLILNLQGFWDPLLALLEHQQEQGFVRSGSLRFLIATQPQDIVPMLQEAARDIPESEIRGAAAKATAEEM